MVDIEIIREWIEKADEDFEFALINFREKEAFFAQICFHFEQSAEKYLKSFIVAMDLPFRKTHDLQILLQECQTVDPSFVQLHEACEHLTTYYTETRYPVHWPTQFSREEAERAFQFAETIRDFVRGKMTMILSE
jgi:HEPN domain-containing protein